ncbi:MAG: DNA-methyltransferase [Gammaproteobacteria bacterium]
MPQTALAAPPPEDARPSARRMVSENKIRCGDALPMLRAIPQNDIFDVVVADPPYNIGKDFGNDSDSRPLPDYLRWCDEWIGECLRLAKDGAPMYIYGYPEILAHIAVRRPPDAQRWLVWHYTNKTVPTSRFWQRSHESILCLWKGARPRLNVDAVREEYTETFLKNAAGKVRRETFCRYSSKGRKTIYAAHPKGALPRDVLKISALAGGAGYAERWFYCKTCRRLCEPREAEAHRAHEVVRHPTQKPAALGTKLISSAAKPGGFALIPFAGSGSECVAAKAAGINFFAAEINPDYARLANAWLKTGRIR